MERLIYIIPTPIGNLEDITLRSIRILKESDLILVEDSRVTRKLLQKYNISTKMMSYHAFNEHKKIDSGLKIALVSDAGTPSISDPGFLLIRACIQNDITISCLPGPTACITALVKSGLPSVKFQFEGFLPVKKKRKKLINTIANYENTTIIYESPHKILKTLNELHEACGERNIVVVKELSKIYETAYRGNIQQVINNISNSKLKGEFIILLDGKK